MCELIAARAGGESVFRTVGPEGVEVGATTISEIDPAEGWVIQCWHPETGEWATMLPPVEGMAWQMTPGSRMRAIPADEAGPPDPSMAAQVKAVAAWR